jgi:SAM-dependent methyltransferase
MIERVSGQEPPTSNPLTPETFDAAFLASASSPTLMAIVREVYGSEYPEDAEPYSFVTVSDLRRISDVLAVGAGQTVLDLCCGRGGPGLCVAQATGASLIGVDWSPVGVAHAQKAALRMGLADRAWFEVADASATGLPDESCDAVMSIDALQLVPDRPAAIREVARVLRPGGVFAFTTWEIDPRASNDSAEQRLVRDHTPTLEAAGLRVEYRAPIPGSREYEKGFFEGILAHRDELTAEMGPAVAGEMCEEANTVLPKLDAARRVLIVARRTRMMGSSPDPPPLVEQR